MKGSPEGWAQSQIEIARGMGLIIPNEFLFFVFYTTGKWKRPVTSVKLAKDLGAHEKLVRDHLNLLTKLRFLEKRGQKYRLSELGTQGFFFLHQSLGANQNTSRWITNSDEFSQVFIGESASIASDLRTPVSVASEYGLTNGASTDGRSTAAAEQTSAIFPLGVITENAA